MSDAGSSQSDIQLVKRVQKGDSTAFDLLVIKYQYKVQAVISRFVREQADIQDIAQEAFIKAYRAIGNFRGDSQFYTWLYRIAVNAAKNHLMTKSRRPSSDVDVDDAEFFDNADFLRDNQTPETELYRDQLQEKINQTISELSEDLRTAICLREIDGLSYEEIALIMSCPLGTVRSRIFRAREALSEKINLLI